MKLDGHNKLTQQAIKEIYIACPSHPIGSNLSGADLPNFVVSRDIIDVAIVGHWSDFGQKHHFMRRFDGQSPFEAYKESVSWIQSNALQAAKHLSRRMQRYLHLKPGQNNLAASSQSCSLPGMTSNRNTIDQGRTVMRGESDDPGVDDSFDSSVNWQHFGNAIHALQDSFSLGHVVRSQSASVTRPGAIEYIKKYSGSDKENHDLFDRMWRVRNSTDLSVSGRQAVNATKSIILMVIRTAQLNAPGRSLSSLREWDSFKLQWLAASPRLSTQRDFAVDIIERFQSGWQIGDNNVKSINMDEAGLANSLYKEAGTDTEKLFQVFNRLDIHYNSDVDDVAVLYVNLVRKNGGAVAQAIGKDKKLIELLIKVMDEDYTAENEAKAIAYLKTL